MIRNIDNNIMLQNTLNTSKNASITAREHAVNQSVLNEVQKVEERKLKEVVQAKSKAEAGQIVKRREDERDPSDEPRKQKGNQERKPLIKPKLPEPVMIRKRFNASV